MVACLIVFVKLDSRGKRKSTASIGNTTENMERNRNFFFQWMWNPIWCIQALARRYTELLSNRIALFYIQIVLIFVNGQCFMKKIAAQVEMYDEVRLFISSFNIELLMLTSYYFLLEFLLLLSFIKWTISCFLPISSNRLYLLIFLLSIFFIRITGYLVSIFLLLIDRWS